MRDYMYIIIPFLTLFLCQIIKFMIESIKSKKFKWGRLFNGTGGMPSSHTAFSFSLVFTILFSKGITSIEFALSLVFAIIVAYDAMGLRRESGRQAEMINDLLDEVFETQKGLTHLKEELGHKPMEVLVGILFAFIIAFLINILL